MVDFDKKWQFLVGNMCNPARRTPGTAEREASVAEMLASEARHARTRGHAGATRMCMRACAGDREWVTPL